MDFEADMFSKFWVPVLFIILSLPFLYKKIPPNHILGIRTKKTLSDKRLWYQVNRTGGLYLLVTGIVLFLYKVFEPIFGFSPRNFAGVVFVVLMIALLIFAVHARRLEG